MNTYDVSMTGRFYADTPDEAFHLALSDLYSLDVNVERVRDPDLDGDDPVEVMLPEHHGPVNER